MPQYGKKTQYLDASGKQVYEFDKVQNLKTGEIATVVFRDYPDFPGVVAYALKDDGTFCELQEYGFYEVLPDLKADQTFCAQYDYRRSK